jgi:hypothetical protein
MGYIKHTLNAQVWSLLSATGWCAIFDDGTAVPLVAWVHAARELSAPYEKNEDGVEQLQETGIFGVIAEGKEIILAVNRKGFKTYDFGYEEILSNE